MITERTRKIIGWGLAALICLLLLASAADKIAGSDHALEMSSSFGLSKDTYRILGIIEAGSALLFLLPRTGLLGTLLLASYLGGAIATHLQHQQSIVLPVIIEIFVWIAAVIRFPELTERFFGNENFRLPNGKQKN